METRSLQRNRRYNKEPNKDLIVKKSMDGLHSRMEGTEEITSVLEDRTIEVSDPVCTSREKIEWSRMNWASQTWEAITADLTYMSSVSRKQRKKKRWGWKFTQRNHGWRLHTHCWWGCHMARPLWKTVRQCLKKLNLKLPYGPAVVRPGIYLREMKTVSTRTPVHKWS